MIVQITNLERGERETKKGATQEGLWVTGIKMEDDGTFADDEYEKFLSEQFDSDFITIIENFGIDSELNLAFVKDGRFWNLDSVTDNKARSSSGGGNGPKSDSRTPKTDTGGRKSSGSRGKTHGISPAPQEPPVVLNAGPEAIRISALQLAIKMADVAAKLKGLNPKMKIFPIATTPELLAQTVQTTAESFEKYITATGEGAAKPVDERKPGSDDDKVMPDEEPIDIPEDEIPF